MTALEKISSITKGPKHIVNVTSWEYGLIVGRGEGAWYHSIRGGEDIEPEGPDKIKKIIIEIRARRAEAKKTWEASKKDHQKMMQCSAEKRKENARARAAYLNRRSDD